MSYNGKMSFGLLGDYDAMPDIDAVAEGIEASLAELVDLARREAGGDAPTAANGRAGSRAPADAARR
jgi:hypothetical protein